MGDSCEWCRRPLPEGRPTGRPRRYCRRSCRQRAYEARRRATELGWGDDRLGALRLRMDDAYVATAGLADIVDELADTTVDQMLLERLSASLEALKAVVALPDG